VVIRSEETGYAAEHFRAQLRFDAPPVPQGPPDQTTAGLPPSTVDPAVDLYGDVLFQGDRFQRLRRYHRAAARDVDVDVAALGSVGWFAGFLPDTLLLGDPGVRDALMHGNQVCVPDATLLPAGIERLYPAGDRLSGDQELRYCATERSRDGDTYVYDIVLRDGTGTAIERWDGLRLHAVRKRDGRGPWSVPLLAPYLERTVEDLTGTRVAVGVEPDGTEPAGRDYVAVRRARTALAAGRALGRPVTIRYRPDGRPEIDGGTTVSAAHGAGLTLCVAGTGPAACDVEPVVARTDSKWDGLLGRHRELTPLVAAAADEGTDTAATRVWAAVECLQKAGRPTTDPLVLRPSERAGWIVFGSGELRVATLATTLRDLTEPVVFAVLTEGSRPA
jgi:enediyne polyketide synthase